eukprot:786007_1
MSRIRSSRGQIPRIKKYIPDHTLTEPIILQNSLFAQKSFKHSSNIHPITNPESSPRVTGSSTAKFCMQTSHIDPCNITCFNHETNNGMPNVLHPDQDFNVNSQKKYTCYNQSSYSHIRKSQITPIPAFKHQKHVATVVYGDACTCHSPNVCNRYRNIHNNCPGYQNNCPSMYSIYPLSYRSTLCCSSDLPTSTQIMSARRPKCLPPIKFRERSRSAITHRERTQMAQDLTTIKLRLRTDRNSTPHPPELNKFETNILPVNHRINNKPDDIQQQARTSKVNKKATERPLVS